MSAVRHDIIEGWRWTRRQRFINWLGRVFAGYIRIVAWTEREGGTLFRCPPNHTFTLQDCFHSNGHSFWTRSGRIWDVSFNGWRPSADKKEQRAKLRARGWL